VRSALILLVLTLACGCSKRDPAYADKPPSLIPRRGDVPFTPQVEPPSDHTLALSRRIDDINALMERGAFDQAQKQLDGFFAAGETHPRAFFLQGKLHERIAAHEAAIPWFQKAVEASPRWGEPRIHLAQCYHKLDRLVAAEGVFDEIDRLLPKSPWGPYGKGLIARQRGDSPRATALLDEALARDPLHAKSLRLRAEFARVDKESALQEQLLRRYLVEEPRDASAYFELGDIAAAAGRASEARRSLATSFELDPQPETARRLAELAVMRGDKADARLWQERAGITPESNDQPETR
jgi:tetratricopeptide (TPR) repeat protein